ncbi:MAG: hypothetical protein MAG581_02234 [Deltaproteobacteria bacterium]|jgi:hypothetical protein|nr:hypothetical protein [Deltaproteobacteria bacterium]
MFETKTEFEESAMNMYFRRTYTNLAVLKFQPGERIIEGNKFAGILSFTLSFTD